MLSILNLSRIIYINSKKKVKIICLIMCKFLHISIHKDNICCNLYKINIIAKVCLRTLARRLVFLFFLKQLYVLL